VVVVAGHPSAPSPLGTVTSGSPAQISQAYGFNQITFNNGTVQGDGTGQTIAIVDAYEPVRSRALPRCR
jgi:hypothetical protein